MAAPVSSKRDRAPTKVRSLRDVGGGRDGNRGGSDAEAAKESAREKRQKRVAAKLEAAEREYKKLRKSLGGQEKSDTCVSMYSVILDDVLDLIPKTKAEIDDDPTNTTMGYLFIALTGTARDLASEIRAVADLEAQAEVITKDIIMPNATKQMQNLLEESCNLQDDLKAIVPPKHRKEIKALINNMIERHAGMVNTSVKAMQDEIKERLLP